MVLIGDAEDGMAERRKVRIAAMADIHLDANSSGRFREMFARVNREADVLAVCGDLTTHGEPDQARAFVDEIEGVEIPIVAVLGNHDHECERTDEFTAVLRERGIHLLDGDPVEIEGVGFTGVKGFGGGFGRGMLGAFGEPLYKQFVQAALDEALKLETGLRKLNTPSRVVLLHYSPIPETLRGEPEVIFPFLGSSRLLPPLETYGADVVFHGHAHIGSPEGSTPSGIPVYNVAHGLLMRHYQRPYRIWEAAAPERRRRE
jgi:Icc-related predicted phosphoesterase